MSSKTRGGKNKKLVLLPIDAALLGLIRVYKYAISPCLGPCCRFHPSCSDYMAEALHRYGTTKGLYLGLKRICRCHPWHPGGFDPLP